METVKSCNDVRQSLVDSGLHYFINESPHSIWITIRKKFLNIPPGNFPQSRSLDVVQVKKEDVEAELKGLEEKHKLLEAAYEKLRFEYESEISDHQETKVENAKLYEQVDRKEKADQILKQEIKTSEASLEAMENQYKKLNKIVKEKEKEIYNLKTEHTKAKVDLEKIDKELK